MTTSTPNAFPQKSLGTACAVLLASRFLISKRKMKGFFSPALRSFPSALSL